MKKIEKVDVDGSTPKKEIKIADCGIIKVETPFNVEKESTE